MMQPADPALSLHKLGRIVLRHKKKTALAFVLILGGVVAVTLLGPRSYTSEAKLLVRLGRENATLDPTATLGQSPVIAVPPSTLWAI